MALRLPPFNRLWMDFLQQRIQSLPGSIVTINRAWTPPESIKKRKQAAVLVPLCNRHGVPSLIFTLRTKTLSTHKGQVSFPGGHLEDKERPIEAAIREANEELGEGIGDIRVLGLCQTIPAITGTMVTPIIGYVEEDVADFEMLSPNDDEVDHIFTRSIEEILSPGFRTEETLSRDGVTMNFPVYGTGEERIWGFTAVVLDAVMREVVIPSITSSDMQTNISKDT
jgi:8-oxo-dGTP pyrophosphatase MutT (NUDIX family)